MLLLFDIDGTLIRSGGAGRRALERAFVDVLSVEGALQGVRLHGSTDLVIVKEAFELHVGHAPSEDDPLIAKIFETYAGCLQAELDLLQERYEVLPGAREIASAAAANPRMVVGLATGNLERTARLKLEPGGLNPFFGFGGFGSDSARRAELVAAGIARGQRLAQQRLGRTFDSKEILVFGDTERDVEAARAAGAQAVGVLSGSTYRDALLEAAPDLCFDSFEASELWDLLGL